MACRLLEKKYIVPIAHDARGHPLFDAQTLHRSLGRLARGIGIIEPRAYRSGNSSKKNDEIVIDEAELARLLE